MPGAGTSLGAGTSSDAQSDYNPRFLPHQQMIKATPKAPKQNLLTRMTKHKPPFASLWEAVSAEPRRRIRVVTRDEHGIHGRLEGYLVLFDKHWNLAMTDVSEVYYRTAPRRAKDFFHGDPARVTSLADQLSDLAVSERLPGRGRGRGHVVEDAVVDPGLLPDVVVKREAPDEATRETAAAAATVRSVTATVGLPDPEQLVPRLAAKGRGKRTREALADWQPLPKVYYRAHGKRQECLRHVGQLLVRGEHVVYVQLLTPSQMKTESV